MWNSKTCDAIRWNTIKILITIFFSFRATAENFVLAPRSVPINILLVIDCRVSKGICLRCAAFPIDCITNFNRSYFSSEGLPTVSTYGCAAAQELYSNFLRQCHEMFALYFQ
jgi:hypothetical protein